MEYCEYLQRALAFDPVNDQVGRVEDCEFARVFHPAFTTGMRISAELFDGIFDLGNEPVSGSGIAGCDVSMGFCELAGGTSCPPNVHFFCRSLEVIFLTSA